MIKTTLLLTSIFVALAGCGSSTGPSDGEVADSGAADARLLADGAACLANGQPTTAGCSACCSGNCGGSGIVAACMP